MKIRRNKINQLIGTSIGGELAVLSIRGYQKWISPRKGFVCACGYFTGSSGCSELGIRAIRKYGLFHGLIVLKKRLRKCSNIYRASLIDKIGKEMVSIDCDIGSCNWPAGSGEKPFDCYWFSKNK